MGRLNSPTGWSKKNYAAEEGLRALFPLEQGPQYSFREMVSATVLADFRVKAIEAFQNFQCGHVLEPRIEADTTHQSPD